MLTFLSKIKLWLPILATGVRMALNALSILNIFHKATKEIAPIKNAINSLEGFAHLKNIGVNDMNDILKLIGPFLSILSSLPRIIDAIDKVKNDPSTANLFSEVEDDFNKVKAAIKSL